MNLRVLDSLAPALVRLHRRIGWVGIAGVAMVVVAAWSAWQAPRWKNEARQLESRTVAERARLEELSRDVASRPDSNRQISQFIGWFPRFEQSTADLGKIYAQAEAQHIVLPKGEYQLSREIAAEFLSYEVIFPVKDSYANVRRFVAAVLKDLPHAALSELRIERTNAETEQVEARVHFSIIYRGV